MPVRIASIAVLVLLAGCRVAPPAAPAHVFAHGAVAADHPAASEAGAEVLRLGGNAVDAAVATSFCLSVVRPYSCGIGGGGFMVIHVPAAADGRPSRQVAINYRETAPGAVGPDAFVGRAADASRIGAHAVGVPGSVAGLLYALEHFGTLDRETVLAPAIRVAEEGFVIDAHYVAAVKAVGTKIDEDPRRLDDAGYVWRELCHAGDVRPGDRLTNPRQARALRLIARDGAFAFYRGPIADAIVDVMKRRGGPITAADLAGYRVDVTAPLRGRWSDYEVVAMPPPSSGGITMLQILGILDRLDVDAATTDHNDTEYVHLLAEAMKHAFADRSRWLADPAFVDVPTGDLLAAEYLDARAAAISRTSTGAPMDYGTGTDHLEDGGTSHFSVVDRTGMAVACTETINLRFGSLLGVPGFGFALNNEMDDFTTIPGAANAFGLRQSDRNLPEPGKRPLSSMSPTIVLRDDVPVIVAGASGGPRIITGTLQTILNCLWYDMPPHVAVEVPRFHHQWMPDRVYFDERWADTGVIDDVAGIGHETARRVSVGEVQLILVDDAGVHAASDTRKGGVPAGY
ncbi:MAG: gamma-glutamyltransferase [Planctomycetes bacterium]|nr:gamma-glutamyltransferase [Planctomycetota bacterium]